MALYLICTAHRFEDCNGNEPELTEVPLVDWVHERVVGVALPPVDEEVPPVDLRLLAQSPQREHLNEVINESMNY